MINLLLKLIGFSARFEDEPLEKRQLLAVFALAILLPVIIALWVLTLRYSTAGFSNAGEAAKHQFAQAKEALAVFQKGFENLRLLSGTLFEAVNSRIQESQEKNSRAAKIPRKEEFYSLPIVE
jgi:hypothetical protein